jgi:acetyltransferase-like isoleucine patch superfamily enzyme
MDIFIKLIAIPFLMWDYLFTRDFFSRIRVAKFRLLGASIGERVKIQPGVQFRGCKNIIIGNDVFLGEGVKLISYSHGITIGSNSLIASESIIITRTHLYSDKDTLISRQGYKGAPIAIGKDVWIGFRCVISMGVAIGDGAIIGAISMVNKDVQEFTVCGGVPARFLKLRQ